MTRPTILFIMFLFWASLFASDNQEFRAIWIITSEHISAYSSTEANKERVRTIMDNHRNGNFNAVLWHARQGGTAYYHSSYEPWGDYAGNQDPGYDPLGYAIQEAHKRGLELHAWINVFQTSSMAPGAPAYEHPEWVCRDQAGNPMTSYRSLSPGLAAVRKYTIDVVMEIVRNYDIDGLHLDYVRWNEHSSTMSRASLAKLAPENLMLDGMIAEEQIEELHNNPGSRYLYDVDHPYSGGVPAGFASWEEWWRWSVTEFVRTLHDSIQAVKPWVRLSAAALGRYNWGPWQGYGDVHQDAALWFNEGYIDQLTPMHYHWTSGQGFYDMLTGGCPQCWSQFIQPGIQDGRLFSAGPGSYELLKQKIWERHDEIITACRNVPWLDGFQFFSYDSWSNYRYWDRASATFFKGKTKIRPTRLIDTEAPTKPTIHLGKVDSLTYRIEVTPPAEVDNLWFAIYRSEDNTIDVATDEIIDSHFGNASFSFIDIFDGLQDFNGIYTYAATAFDRYWNESGISNTMQSDAIPSFAPTIVRTSPGAGDTVAINSDIVLQFSKTMEKTTVEPAITIEPGLQIKQFIWSEDQKTVTIIKNQNLNFATHYTITVAATATDVNGKQLDGNSDGVAGDAFVFHFLTKAMDNEGPKIAYSYPVVKNASAFDVADVITCQFDELIDANSIDNNFHLLTPGGTIPEIKHTINDIGDKSILSIQSKELLAPNSDYKILLAGAIADTLGNTMGSDLSIEFRTLPEAYTQIESIDNFALPGDWRSPDYSGSTTGIIVIGTEFGFTRTVAVPAPSFKRSALLKYQWDPSASEFLLREYLAGGSPRDVLFDTTYTLQCYLFGDGSRNKFRFCLDDSSKDRAEFHEVSRWITIDWYGWRLVEWKLSDPNSVGTWLGDGILHGPSLRMDSFQLTHEAGAATSGTIYFDELRLVKKTSTPVAIHDRTKTTPFTFRLFQNYPNPFNPTTTIPFELANSGRVVLKIFNVLGEEVATLVDQHQAAGYYELIFDASQLASGVYYYRLEQNSTVLTQKMLLVR